VGRQVVEVVDSARDGRTLPVQVWYPAEESGEPFTEYVFLPPMQFFSDFALDSPAVAASPTEAGFPTVFYSHGNNGWGWVHSTLMERLASHGFVVVAPDHVGNTLVDSVLGTSDEQEVVAQNRLDDVNFVLAALETDPAFSKFADSADETRIGFVSHSLGGWTGLTTLGQQGADSIIDAYVGLAPFVEVIDDETFAAIDRPVLMISGSVDETTPAVEVKRPFDIISSRPLIWADVIGGGHQSFADACFIRDQLGLIAGVPDLFLELADGYAESGCGEGIVAVDVAQPAMNHLATAFLVSNLGGDVGNALDPAYIETEFPGVFTIQVGD